MLALRRPSRSGKEDPERGEQQDQGDEAKDSDGGHGTTWIGQVANLVPDEALD